MTFTPDEIRNLPDIFSAPRFATYLTATSSDTVKALELYKWNLQVSGAFLAPLQICEVCIRNAISDAIERTYGANWPYAKRFQITLPNPQRSYSAQENLKQLCRGTHTTGKIIAELKFIFWERMFTGRHDNAVWNPHLRSVFPNMEQGKTVQQLRKEAYDTLYQIRILRNRIAHHEPIFKRDIQKEYDRIKMIISWRSTVAAEWLDKIETVTPLIATKP